MNWKNRIEQAVKTKSFTYEDKRLCVLWTTDLISEVKDKIQLRDNKIELGPIDIYLILDGIWFTMGVEKNDIGLVENCYKSIHKRVEALNKNPL